MMSKHSKLQEISTWTKTFWTLKNWWSRKEDVSHQHAKWVNVDRCPTNVTCLLSSASTLAASGGASTSPPSSLLLAESINKPKPKHIWIDDKDSRAIYQSINQQPDAFGLVGDILKDSHTSGVCVCVCVIVLLWCHCVCDCNIHHILPPVHVDRRNVITDLDPNHSIYLGIIPNIIPTLSTNTPQRP